MSRLSARTSRCSNVSPAESLRHAGLVRGELVEVRERPRVEVARRGDAHPGPAAEVLAELVPEWPEARRRRGQQPGVVDEHVEHEVEVVGLPRLVRMPAVEVLEGERHPVAVVDAGQQPRHRQARWQSVEGVDLATVHGGGVRMDGCADRLDERPASVGENDAVRRAGGEAAWLGRRADDRLTRVRPRPRSAATRAGQPTGCVRRPRPWLTPPCGGRTTACGYCADTRGTRTFSSSISRAPSGRSVGSHPFEVGLEHRRQLPQ